MFGCSFSVLLGWPGWWGMFAAALVVAVAICLLMNHGKTKRRKADSDDSISILKRRLAAGEITADEFNMLKQYL